MEMHQAYLKHLVYHQKVEGLRLLYRDGDKIVEGIFDGQGETFDPNNDDHFIPFSSDTNIKERVITVSFTDINVTGFDDPTIPQKIIDYAIANNITRKPNELHRWNLVPLINPFFLDSNGVTIKLKPGYPVGTTGLADDDDSGTIYTAVDDTTIRNLDPLVDDYTNICTTLCTDMTTLFIGDDFNQDIGFWDMSNVTTLYRMFYGSTFNQDISFWDVSNVTDMRGVFYSSDFNQPLNSWDVSSVEYFGDDINSFKNSNNGMFSRSKYNQPLNNWNTVNVKSTAFMFNGSTFNQDIQSWSLPQLETTYGMFSNQFSEFNQPLNNFDISNVLEFNFMFSENPVFNQDLSNWVFRQDVSLYRIFGSFNNSNSQTEFNHPSINAWDMTKVSDVSYMFLNSKFNQDLSNWDLSNLTSLLGLFAGSDFNHPSINSWDMSTITSTSEMFFASRYNQPLNNWNTSNITDMSFMFGAKRNDSTHAYSNNVFNQDISGWDVSNVTNMRAMFGARFQTGINLGVNYGPIVNFDQPLNSWDVSNVTDMTEMFMGCRYNKPLDNWNTTSLQNATHMFAYSEFNSAIFNPNLSGVTSLEGFFGRAIFNQDIGSWNVSTITDMSEMFRGASSFNQDISGWCVENIPSQPTNFAANSPLDSNPSFKPNWGNPCS
jgi:surface protein